MVVRDEKQALDVAVEMEKRAIRTYERALMLANRPEVIAGIKAILEDERQHLCRFSAMRGAEENAPAEEAVLTDALAAEALFTGGVSEMTRARAMTTLCGLYTYAAESEADAVETYTAFAEKSATGEVKAAFLAIAKEEQTHLDALRKELAAMEEKAQ